jgi:hypothetical protein
MLPRTIITSIRRIQCGDSVLTRLATTTMDMDNSEYSLRVLIYRRLQKAAWRPLVSISTTTDSPPIT